MHHSPATRHLGDLGERQLQQDLFQIVHHVHPGPVHRDDHVVLGQARAGEFKRLVETREQEGPLEACVVDHVFLHAHLVHVLLDVVALMVKDKFESFFQTFLQINETGSLSQNERKIFSLSNLLTSVKQAHCHLKFTTKHVNILRRKTFMG